MTSLTPLFQLVYISEALEDLSYSDLENILKSARLKNQALDVTGVLIHRDGFFIQLLEGPKDHVKEVMSRIFKDNRHKNIRIIHEWDHVPNRFFQDWSMSFLDGDIADDKNPFIQKIFSDAMLVDFPDHSQFHNFFNEIQTQSSLLK